MDRFWVICIVPFHSFISYWICCYQWWSITWACDINIPFSNDKSHLMPFWDGSGSSPLISNRSSQGKRISACRCTCYYYFFCQNCIWLFCVYYTPPLILNDAFIFKVVKIQSSSQLLINVCQPTTATFKKLACLYLYFEAVCGLLVWGFLLDSMLSTSVVLPLSHHHQCPIDRLFKLTTCCDTSKKGNYIFHCYFKGTPFLLYTYPPLLL